MEIESEKLGLMKEQLDKAMDFMVKASGDYNVAPGEYYPRFKNVSQQDLIECWYAVSEAWEIITKHLEEPPAMETLVLSGKMLEIDMSMTED